MQPSSAGSFSITPSVRKEIVKIIDARIAEAHVTKEDFSELKSIVKDLAEAQKRTEVKVEELAEAQKELATSQKELATSQKELATSQKELATSQKELATSQKEMQAAIISLTASHNELAASQKEMQKALTKLATEVKELRIEFGGFSRSFSYAFENETYRFLPPILREKYDLMVQEKIVRAEIAGQEVNLFCRAERNGKPALVVGEARLQLVAKRLQKKPNVFDELEEKVEAVRSEHGDKEIVKVLVTHYADKAFLRKAQELDVIVVQSYEW